MMLRLQLHHLGFALFALESLGFRKNKFQVCSISSNKGISDENDAAFSELLFSCLVVNF